MFDEIPPYDRLVGFPYYPDVAVSLCIGLEVVIQLSLNIFRYLGGL